jgi:ABC-2 type transport system permease protein
MSASTGRAAISERRGTPGWVVVLARELRDLWVGGRGLTLCFAFSILVSAIAYLAATNEALNFLEQREALNLVVQVGMIVGALLTLLAGADAISGERERGTLESLLLTPVSRRQLAGAKLLAALSLWLAAYAILVPYGWFLARSLGVVGSALAASFVVGTLLAIFFASFGLLVSLFASSNRASLSIALLALLALFAPTQLPGGAKQGWFADVLLHVNPATAGERFVNRVIISASSWDQELGWLVSPLVSAALLSAAALLLASRMRLGGGAGG